MKVYRVELSRVVTQTAVVYVTAHEGDRDSLQNEVSDLTAIRWQTKETGKDVIDINRAEQTGGF